MSCQILSFAQFEDIKSVRKYLFRDLKEDSKIDEESSGWDNNDWGWKEENEVTREKESECLSWLQECSVSIAPTADMIALAHQDKLVLLNHKYTHDTASSLRFSLVYEGSVAQTPGEKITSVLCLPLASQKRSTQGGADWNCIIVGFSTGYIRMYTENGTLLLSQIFSDQPVIKVKCRTYQPARHPGLGERHEELTILYKNALVSIDGFSLCQSLRACRNQVARAAASGSEFVPPPPLSYKKWALSDQEIATDVAVYGGVTPNYFDDMQSASMIQGFNASVKLTPSAKHLYIAVGKNPFTGFFYIVDGSVQPMLSDVAVAVASKLKSAFVNAASGWFGFSRSGSDPAKDKKRAKIEPATPTHSRFGLFDNRRQGESISLSPDGQLAAITDSFGRVMLIDVNLGIVVRIWKGYRDAHVGWTEAREDPVADGQAVPRKAMFLVIYAPRRGILEVWLSQQGPRVAAFNVSRWSRLVHHNYGMLGLNNVTYRTVQLPPNCIYLVDPDGAVRTIEVPFHLALSDKNSKRARDLHILKKLRVALSEFTGTEVAAFQGEVNDMLLDIRTANIRQQGVQKVLQTPGLSCSFLQTVLKALINQLHIQQESLQSSSHGEDSACLDYDSQQLLLYCEGQLRVLHTYSAVHKLNSSPLSHISEPQAQASITQELQTVLQLSLPEVEQVQHVLAQYQSTLATPAPGVSFQEGPLTPQEFMTCLDCQVHKEKDDSNEFIFIAQLQKNLVDSTLCKLADFFFKLPIDYGAGSSLHMALQQSHIVPGDLMKLLLHIWLAKPTVDLQTVNNVHGLVKCITSFAETSHVEAEASSVSPWWQTVRTALINTPHLAPALLFALVAKSIAVDDTKVKDSAVPEEDNSSDSDTSLGAGWEAVSMERAQWVVLARQLEDLLVLQTLLNTRPPGYINIPWEHQPVHATVVKVIEAGRGVLPELMAKWISGYGISPSMLCLSADDQDEMTNPASENELIRCLQAVQARLPHSLDSDILMANCTWEYMVLWNKDPEVILPLELAISYMKCIQNTSLQQGVCLMMWQMFLVKKLASAAQLVEKVGKTPKDRLCRRDVGLSEISLENFLQLTVDLLDCIMQGGQLTGEVPVFHAEDCWHNMANQQSLVSLALEQKECNLVLACHHRTLALILQAVFVFTLKGVKPLSLFDTKGKGAFFKPLQSYPPLPMGSVDDTLIKDRQKVLIQIIGQAVRSIEDSPQLSSSAPKLHYLALHGPVAQFLHWPDKVMELATELDVNVDMLRRFHCLELYACGLDLLGLEVLRTVNDRAALGSQLAVMAGKRLHYFVFETDIDTIPLKLSHASTTLSCWLKALDYSTIRSPNQPLSDTVQLLGHVANLLPEGGSEYKLVIEMIEFSQSFVTTPARR